MGAVLGRDALALVGDGDDHVAGAPADPDPDPAFDGVLDGVLDQVGEDAVEPARVGRDQRQALTAVDLEETSTLRPWAIGSRASTASSSSPARSTSTGSRLITPASKRLISRSSSRFSNRSSSRSSSTAARWASGGVVPGGVDVVGGHARTVARACAARG